MVSTRFLVSFVVPASLLAVALAVALPRFYPPEPNPRYEIWKFEVAAGDSAYQELGFRHAEQRYRRALMLCLEEKGTEHLLGPDITAQTMSDLAEAVSAQGRHDEALQLLSQALGIAERARGRSSPEALAVLEDMRSIYHTVDFDSLTAACDARIDSVAIALEPIYRRAVEIQEARRKRAPLALAEKVTELGELYLTRGRADRAEALFTRALTLRERKLGRHHEVTVTTRFQLGLAAFVLRKYTSAAEAFRGILARIEADSGPESPQLLPVMDRLAEAELNRGSFEAAESLYARALEIRRARLGDDHPALAASYSGIASAQLGLGHALDARAAEERALEIESAVFGEEHRRVGVHLMRLGEIEAKCGDLKQARAACALALDILTKELGRDHELTAECRDTLEELKKPAMPDAPSLEDAEPVEEIQATA